MSEFWSPFVEGLDPYVPGEQPQESDIIKLNTNENPFPPSPKVIEAIKNAVGNLQLYPDPESVALRQSIAKYHSDNEQALTEDNIFVGNGSDEVLAHAFNAFFRNEKPVLFPDITYGFYPVYCKLYDIPFEQVVLTGAYEIGQEYSNARKKPVGGIALANPNAPTGILLDVPSIRSILEKNSDIVVLIDEAYIDFAENEKTASAISLVGQHPNLLITRTLSKSRSLAGLRVGYAVGQSHLVEGLNRVKNSFNSFPVDRLAQVAALASIEDERYFQEKRRAVILQREFLVAELESLGFSILPAATNFIMVQHIKKKASEIAGLLREKKIVVRHFNKPRLEDFLRITVGDEAQNRALVSALKSIFS